MYNYWTWGFSNTLIYLFFNHARRVIHERLESDVDLVPVSIYHPRVDMYKSRTCFVTILALRTHSSLDKVKWVARSHLVESARKWFLAKASFKHL